eukprot:2328354-Pyramimonas_sp.AAC.1
MAPTHELPFEWVPKQCNGQDAEHSDENPISWKKQLAILSRDTSARIGTTFWDGRIDIVGAVVRAFRCNKTALFIGGYDCALSLGIMMHAQE